MLSETQDRKLNPELTAILAIVAMALFTTAATITVLSDGESGTTLTFSGEQDLNAYISVPLNANVTSATIDAQGQVMLFKTIS